MVLGECDHSVVTSMVNWHDTLDENLSPTPATGSSPIPTPGVSMTDNDILRSSSRKLVSIPSVHVGSLSTIDRESAKEVVVCLSVFRMNQQQKIIEPYGEMEAVLDYQITRNCQLKEQFWEL